MVTHKMPVTSLHTQWTNQKCLQTLPSVFWGVRFPSLRTTGLSYHSLSPGYGQWSRFLPFWSIFPSLPASSFQNTNLTVSAPSLIDTSVPSISQWIQTQILNKRWGTRWGGISLGRPCRVLLGFLWTPKHQKGSPGSKDKLHEQRSSWKANAGCSRKPTKTCPASTDSLEPPWRDGKRPFIQDTCLYECFLNLGPWVQQLDQSGHREPIWTCLSAKMTVSPRGKTAAPTLPRTVLHNVTSVQWGFLPPLRFLLPTPATLQWNRRVAPTAGANCSQGSGHCTQMWFFLA